MGEIVFWRKSAPHQQFTLFERNGLAQTFVWAYNVGLETRNDPRLSFPVVSWQRPSYETLPFVDRPVLSAVFRRAV